MTIVRYIAPLSEGIILVKKLLMEEFGLSPETSEILSKDEIAAYFEQLIEDQLYLIAETNYVDKVFRDTYYNYYSSKVNNYKRHCIRLSFFAGPINESDFVDNSTVSDSLVQKYLGFIVLRPTEPYIIGRNVISPKALKKNNLLICSAKISTTVNSIKFKVEGFPHSSQDTESISCAETTLWAMMEFFSNKYSEYSQVLPSKITKTLRDYTSERQLPTRGLDIEQMSFALREFGFGTRIYSRQEYGIDFESLLSTYIESGIPLILGMDNWPSGTIGHAFLCIGHEMIGEAEIDDLQVNQLSNERLKKSLDKQNIVLYDWSQISKKFIFIDDNFPPYRKAPLMNPAIGYPPHWETCLINHFIVPLYPKIYLEAYEAKNFIYSLLLLGPVPLKNDSEILLRFYLASSNSFKEKIALDKSFDQEVRDVILETLMSRFIWVAEISTKTLIKQKMANGLIILDSTEANIYNAKPLIIGLYQGKKIKVDSATGALTSDNHLLNSFKIYESNLKLY